MHNARIFAGFALALAASAGSLAQSSDSATPAATTAGTVVPALIRFSGIDPQANGKERAGVTFLIYKDEQGGEPLWEETQSVSFDPAGHYAVYLGATGSSGLPLDLFANGEARWLEVEIAGEKQPPRVLLTSVPYAMKALDAATLGGLPASAFALASANPAAAQTTPSPDASASTVTTPGGTAGYLPVYSGSTTIDDSILYESSTKIGIGTNTPASTLDVNGAITGRGALTMESTGTSTSSTAKNSQPVDFMASVYNSSTKKALYPVFALQAEGVSNNTSAPSGTLNLLYGDGATPAETGLSISNKGIIKFATGQTFPSSSSTGVGVEGTSTSGTGVEGTSSSGSGVVGDTAGSAVGTAGVVGIAGSGNTSGFGGIAGVWGNASAHVGVLGTSDKYAGVQGLSNSSYGVEGSSNTNTAVLGTSTSGSGVSGLSTSNSGVAGYTEGSTLNTAGAIGIAGSRTSFSGIAGIWGDAAAHVGVFGSSNQYAGVEGSSVSAQGVQGNSTSGNGVHGVSQSTSGIFGETSSTSNADAALYGYSHDAAMGVYGSSPFGIGVSGSSYAYDGVYGVSTANNGVGGETNDSDANDFTAGVYGYSSTAQVGVQGASAAGIGGYFTGGTNSAGGAGVNSTGGSGTNTGGDGIYATGGSSASGVGGYGGEFYGGTGTGSGGGGYGGKFAGGNGASGGIGALISGGLPTVSGGEYGDGLIVSATRSTTDTSGYSLFVDSDGGSQTTYIAFFQGSVTVEGELDAELPSVKIDDPTDPANKYLAHASVQSSEMMNLYTGNVVTDELGLATVTLPSWFESMNTDFRYQLTVLGQFAQAIVKEKVANGRFTIMTNAPHVEVSWQITAVRNDAFARANPLVVEQEKPVGQRGFYQHPEFYGQPAERETKWGMRPALMRRLRDHGQPANGRATAQSQNRSSKNLKPLTLSGK